MSKTTYEDASSFQLMGRQTNTVCPCDTPYVQFQQRTNKLSFPLLLQWTKKV